LGPETDVEEKNLLSLLGNEQWFLSCAACSLVTILTAYKGDLGPYLTLRLPN
jgi:hypothetical protein